MRLRQIALVSRDLEQASSHLRALLDLGPAYQDPGVGKYGLHNAVYPIGDTFLEVVSPTRPDTTAGRLMDKRGGDCGYMVILQVKDIEEARARIHGLGVRVVDQADYDGVAMTHLHPKDVGAAILSIDAMAPEDRWEWGGPDWRQTVKTTTALTILGAELIGSDGAALASRWAAVLGRTVQPTAFGWTIVLDDGALAFRTMEPGEAEGLAAFDVAVRDKAAVFERAAVRGLLSQDNRIRVCGTELRLH